MADDKVRELVDKLLLLEGERVVMEFALERILRAELKPLLDIAEIVCEVHGEKHPTSSVHRLAAELRNWRKE